MRLEHLVLKAVLVDHHLEVDIDVLAASQVGCLLLFFLLLHDFHLQPTLFPLLLQLLYLIEGVSFCGILWLSALLHRTCDLK